MRLVQTISDYRLDFTKSKKNKNHPYQQLTIGCVSRLSNRRVGSRFLTRGIDDSGAVANSVETETFLLDESGKVASHCQLRNWSIFFLTFDQRAFDLSFSNLIFLTKVKKRFGPGFLGATGHQLWPTQVRHYSKNRRLIIRCKASF